MAKTDGRSRNVCAKCGAPLRMDNKKCIMGPLCETVTQTRFQSAFGDMRPAISEPQDAAVAVAQQCDRAMNSGIQVVSPDQRTLPANPERKDLCEGCDRYIEHSCTSPHRASSRDAPASPATASTDPASPSQEAYATVKQGLGTPRAPHFDDVPVVTWVGPNGGSDDADAIDEFALPVPGIPDSKAPNSR